MAGLRGAAAARTDRARPAGRLDRHARPHRAHSCPNWTTGGTARPTGTSSPAPRPACTPASDALERGDDRELLARIREARRLLADLDREAGLGIFTARLTALCDAAEAEGGAAKPSGAGGGDCGIALLDDADSSTDSDAYRARIARLHDRWTAAGIRPLPLHVPHPKGSGE